MSDPGFFFDGGFLITPTVVTIGLAVVSLYFRWLIASFNELKISFKEIVKLAQTRHEDNLHRFEKISVALAKLGSDNGTYYKENK